MNVTLLCILGDMWYLYVMARTSRVDRCTGAITMRMHNTLVFRQAALLVWRPCFPPCAGAVRRSHATVCHDYKVRYQTMETLSAPHTPWDITHTEKENRFSLCVQVTKFTSVFFFLSLPPHPCTRTHTHEKKTNFPISLTSSSRLDFKIDACVVWSQARGGVVVVMGCVCEPSRVCSKSRGTAWSGARCCKEVVSTLF